MDTLNMAAPEGAVILFNGENVDNWTTRDGQPAGWKVEDRILHVLPRTGDIMTTQQLTDFCMHLEFRGSDPAAFLQQHGERTGDIHLKDYERAPGVEGRRGLIWRELGNGVVDWKPVFAEIEKLDHIEWALVEQDRTDREPKESLAISRQYLKQQFDY